MKKYLKLFAALVLIVFSSVCFVACGGPKEKNFSCSAGLSITLNDSFYEKELASQTIYLESASAIFCALKEEFDRFSSPSSAQDMTLNEYAQMVIENNSLSSSVTVKTDSANNLTYFEYEKNVSGKNFYYYAVVKKGSDAFWLCQFACTMNNKNSYTNTFVNWAKTITVQ